MTDSFVDRKQYIHKNLVIREVNWETEKSIVSDVWAEGFRLIVPLYWREVVFYPTYFIPTYGGLILICTFISYLVSQAWHGFIIATVLEAILLGGCYKWFSDRVEQAITTGGIYPENVDYLKFFVATLEDRIIGCIGLTDGEELVKTKKVENADTAASETTDEKIASVWRLTVHEDYRKYAVGRRLMTYCEEFLQNEGYNKITLLAGNIDSLNFYDRLKYTKTKLSWEMGYHQSWFYELRLPRANETLLTQYQNENSKKDN